MGSPIVVIGSNSFSGASFVRFMLGLGHRVLGISRSEQAHPALLPYLFEENQAKAFEFYQYDLNNDLELIDQLLDKEKPAWIFNFAAQSMVAQSWEHPHHWYQTNVVSMVKLFDRLRLKDYLDRYVHVSTPEVYGSLKGYVEENANYHPSTPYAISRAAADMHLHAYQKAYGFPVLFTRAANVYGAGQQLYRIIPKTLLSIKAGQKLPLHGGGYSERSFIHIEDVCRATLDIAEKGRLGEIYHIATEKTVSIRQLVMMLCESQSAHFEDVVEETGDRLGKDAAYLLSSKKLREELGWRDHISLEQGIAQVSHWVDERYEELLSLPWQYEHKA